MPHGSTASSSRLERLAAVGTLSGGLAHEINNPLAGIKQAGDFEVSGEMAPVAARASCDRSAQTPAMSFSEVSFRNAT